MIDRKESHNYVMSRPEFSEVLGVSQSTAIKWEKAGLSPNTIQWGNSTRRRYNIDHILEARKKFRPLPKREPTTILFWLLKGGVGKTTVSFNLCGALSRAGYRVLAIDLDGQSHLTTCFGIPFADQENLKTLYNLLYGEGDDAATLDDILVELSPTLHLIPSSLDTAAIDLFLIAEKDPERKLHRLRNLIMPLRAKYDFIILDAPPNINFLNLNAIFAADEIIAPMLTDFLSHHSLSLLYDTFDSLTETFRDTGFKLPTIRLLANHFDIRNNLCQESLGKLKTGEFASQLFKTVIRLSTALAESAKNMKPVFTFAPQSNGARDILALSRELTGEKGTEGVNEA